MKKGTFYRARLSKKREFIFEKCTGYLTTVSNGKITIELAIAKNSAGLWDITHTGTGFLVNIQKFTTRAAALDSLTDEYLNMILKKLQESQQIAAAKRLAQYIEQEDANK